MTPEQVAAELIADGWKRISNKYRMISRSPPGMTGFEALQSVDPSLAKHLKESFERTCASQFMRLATGEELSRELDQATFEAFKSLGGECP